MPEPPFWGVREIDVDLEDVYPYLDRHVLFKLHWGGRGKKGEEWRKIVEGDGDDEGFQPKLERMWAEQDYLHPQVKLGYFPCNSDGNDLVIFDPEDQDKEIERLHLPAPAQARPHLPGRLLPADRLRRARRRGAPGRDRGPRGPPTCMAQLEKDGEFAEQLFTHGLARAVRRGPGRVAALTRRATSWASTPTRAGATPGATRPARTSPSTRRSGSSWASTTIGMYLSDGFAVMPEQSTVAIIAHHPQAGVLRHEVRLRARGARSRTS